MTSKFDKVMKNLQDSIDTSITIEEVEWCQVKKHELEALIECAQKLNAVVRDPETDFEELWMLIECADE